MIFHPSPAGDQVKTQRKAPFLNVLGFSVCNNMETVYYAIHFKGVSGKT